MLCTKKLFQSLCFFSAVTLMISCGGEQSNAKNDLEAGQGEVVVALPPEIPPAIGCGALPCKPLPGGIYESAGHDPVGNASSSVALVGVLLRYNWNECGDDIDCLVNTIESDLDAASTKGIKVALMIMDGPSAPDFVKNQCVTIDYQKRGEPASMCVAWDASYLANKQAMVSQLGQRLDQHPALAYMYFTGACSGNGAEGHCRIDEDLYTSLGYTPEVLATAYKSIMDMYRNAFPVTPLAFEVHEMFESADLWQSVWDHVSSSQRVGVAAWWCSERLTINGSDTAGVWPIVQDAAQNSFSVCQTVGKFTGQPYRFTDLSLGLDYGEEQNWDSTDETNSFSDTFDWIQGYAVHAGQSEMIKPFSVVEVWSADVNNADFQSRLSLFEP